MNLWHLWGKVKFTEDSSPVFWPFTKLRRNRWISHDVWNVSPSWWCSPGNVCEAGRDGLELRFCHIIVLFGYSLWSQAEAAETCLVVKFKNPTAQDQGLSARVWHPALSWMSVLWAAPEWQWGTHIWSSGPVSVGFTLVCCSDPALVLCSGLQEFYWKSIEIYWKSSQQILLYISFVMVLEIQIYIYIYIKFSIYIIQLIK